MNKRQNIVEAINSRLKIIFDPLFVPVYMQRFLPTSVVPVIIIHSGGDTAEKAVSEGHNMRTDDIRIIVSVAGKEAFELGVGESSVSTIIDGYIKLIETDLNRRRETLGDVVHRLNYSGCELTYNTDTDRVVAIAVLRFNAIYIEHLT